MLLLLLIRKHDFRLEFVVDGHFVIKRLLEVSNFLGHERNFGAETNLVLTLRLLLLLHLRHLQVERQKKENEI